MLKHGQFNYIKATHVIYLFKVLLRCQGINDCCVIADIVIPILRFVILTVFSVIQGFSLVT